ncbi:MAG: hypothetical protein ABI411_03795 [Tahibacter sp.]
MNRLHTQRQLVRILGLSLALSGALHAATICTQGANLDIPATSEGLYLNLLNGLSGPTEGSVPGFDIDIYTPANASPPGQLKFYWGSASTGGAGVVTAGDAYAVLGIGQTIGPGSVFSRAAFSGDTSAWQAGASAYLGMRFRNEATAVTNYGWLLLSTAAPVGFPATIRGWCIEDAGAPITTPGDSIFVDGFQ